MRFRLQMNSHHNEISLNFNKTKNILVFYWKYLLQDLKLKNPPDPKFPTECFWITVYYHHIGLVPATRRLARTVKNILQVIKGES